MKLYYAVTPRANRPHWLLEEMGVPYEPHLVNMANKEHKTPAYRLIHPHGSVPALVDGDLVVVESAAICMHVADRFPETAMAPPAGTPDRGRYYQWMVYTAATFDQVVLKLARHLKASAEERVTMPSEDEVFGRFRDALEFVEHALMARDWILGTSFSAADILVGSTLLWARNLTPLADHPLLEGYVDRLAQRPAFLRSGTPQLC